MFVNAGGRVFHRGGRVRMSRVCEDGTAARSNAKYTAAQVLPLVATCRNVGCPRGNARYDLT